MPVIAMGNLSHLAKSVFEDGTLQTKSGEKVPVEYAVSVIEMAGDLGSKGFFRALDNLLKASVEQKPVRLLTFMFMGPDNTKHLLDEARVPKKRASQILQDLKIDIHQMEGQKGQKFLDVSHYEDQLAARASQQGFTVRFNDASGRFKGSLENLIVCRYEGVLVSSDEPNTYEVRDFNLPMFQFLAAAQKHGYSVSIFSADPKSANASLQNAMKYLSANKIVPANTNFNGVRGLKDHFGMEPFMVVEQPGKDYVVKRKNANGVEEYWPLNVVTPDDPFIKTFLKNFQDQEQALDLSLS